MSRAHRLPQRKTRDGQLMSHKMFIPLGALVALLFVYPWFSSPGFAMQAVMAGRPGTPEISDGDLRQMLSIAETQHEIVKVLIEQGRFDRVLPEMRKIFDLKLPDKYESNVAQSASLIANALVESRQFALAHAVLDEAQKRMRQNENKASLLKIQAYVYKSEGNLDKALEALEKAVELERQRNRS